MPCYHVISCIESLRRGLLAECSQRLAIFFLAHCVPTVVVFEEAFIADVIIVIGRKSGPESFQRSIQ